MFNIAICDDTAKELLGIMNELNNYLKRKAPDMETSVDVYSKPEDLLNGCREKRYDLLLLDILMPEKDGIETAKEAREINPEVEIVYISTTSEFALDAFSVNAVSYLLKPFTPEQFEQAMDRVFRSHLEKKPEGITVKNLNGSLLSIDVNDILYIESREKVIRIVMRDSDDILTRSSLTAIYEHLEKYKNIVKCGGSYIINLAGIRRFDAKSMVMNDGTAIPVPRRVMPEMKQRFMDYYDN